MKCDRIWLRISVGNIPSGNVVDRWTPAGYGFILEHINVEGRRGKETGSGVPIYSCPDSERQELNLGTGLVFVTGAYLFPILLQVITFIVSPCKSIVQSNYVPHTTRMKI